MVEKVGEAGHYTPHSLRTNAATRLFQAGVSEQLIQEQTGHSSLAVRRYKRTCSAQKESVCKVSIPLITK